MTAQQGGKDELSRTLLSLRKESGLSTRQVEAALRKAGVKFSQAKVSRLERGINIPTEDDVTALVDAYSAPAATRRRLVGLARDIRAEHRPVVMARSKGRPGLFQARLARIEAASNQVRAFAPTAVPGLLQTPAYIRALISSRDLPAREVEDFIENRVRRQQLLTTSGAPHFTVITTEGAMGWRLGTREDMAHQLAHLAAMTAAADVRVGIIPWGTQAPRVVLHSWDIYDERAVSYGTSEATAILTEARDVARYVELHEMVEQMAVFGDDAREVFERLSADYRNA